MGLGFFESGLIAVLAIARWVVVPLLAYVVIRFGVRHGVRDAFEERDRRLHR
ncbi:hypothetical protein ACTQ49_07800 [Luteococcus sp. Sow4_B9]|uniref:hypothetical protein n=1 Tax=Luteococcus sp. Sow4_B9 TaxID=3438792 RepID=UPI003F9D3101